ncbi:MAG: UDP-N-acetylmuramoyl-L-alanyl-D-glutamate--2,6-diaminopimelate ligase [Anaerolineae bacterium]|nr:UDP-N-acetylmuramoyl-L-alanyl-D-glutamate--2,6-diaminopimelate ligase [Anaerolineae bacterium]
MTQVIRRTLPELFSLVNFFKASTEGLPAREITGVVYDSREVQPGNIFVALKGGNTDGHHYIANAVERGAIAVIGSDALSASLPVPYFRVEDSRKALAEISAAFYDFPARSLTMIGVTGTDGKTTTSALIYSILQAAGIRAGMISTVGAKLGSEELDTGFHVTTPEAPDVQRYLSMMCSEGITHVVLESTSHGLAQYRVGSCEFDLGVVTNITHEHLDYHGSYEAYRDAKALLFRFLAETQPKERNTPRLAVLNKDDRSYPYLHELTRVRQATYSLHPGADLWSEEVVQNHDGLNFIAVGKGFRQAVSSRLAGLFNVSNCLAAMAATVYGLGIDHETAAAGIASLSAVPGRMERIEMGQEFLCIVDFAHTPNALRVALQTARQMATGRVIAVFGSAGLRDRAKRRMMSETAIELADLTILTAEDPRTEALEEILAEMSEAANKSGGIEGKSYWRIPDRGKAIRFALSLAKKGDVVISCGKGHEQSMCFGTVEYPWDDRTAMRAALAEFLNIEGPLMPYLPTQD